MSITLAKLNAQIKSIGNKTAKWRDEVQLCLVGCAQFAFDDRNVDPATRLVKAVTGADATAVIHWIEKHMPAKWITKDVQFRVNKSFVGEYDAERLLAAPWWEHAKKPSSVSSSLDCLDAVRALVKRLSKEAEEGVKTIAHGDLIDTLTKVANDYEFAEKAKIEAAAAKPAKVRRSPKGAKKAGPVLVTTPEVQPVEALAA